MNLALHGFLLQVILSIFNYQYGYQLCSAGEPGYLDFDNLPETNFSCQGKVIGGYYADIEAGCQMFHVCTIGQKDEIMDIKFLCLNGTVFDQETRVCERVDEVDCSKSERFYNLNLELYGNNAVTLSLHEGEDEADESPILIEDQQGTTSTRPSTTTTTTTQRPAIVSSTTAASGPYQHPNGYPQHYQPQPPFPSIQTSQSKSLYDDKNGGYHRQYIYHVENNNERNTANQNDNRATSYQIFSNQGQSSTTGTPQIHQIHYSSTSNPSTVSPIFHATSSTIQSLLSVNNPTLISPIFHNNGISSTTEHFNVHSNAPRDTTIYQQNHNADDETHHHADDHQENQQFLTPIQATSQGKISKLTISPIPGQHEIKRTKQQLKDDVPTISQSQQASLEPQQQQQQHRIAGNFLTIASTGNGSPTVRSFYPTPKASSKSQSSTTTHITQHIHIIPPFTIPQLKPHQVTINLPPPDIQRIVQNPSPLLPTQSRVIVTAKASVSDESGRPLNTTQLVTLPLPTVPASYDDYKEGDESFDPFYRDVPKIRNIRRSYIGELSYFDELRKKRSIRNKRNIDVKKINESVERIVDSEEDSYEKSAMFAGNDEKSVSDYTSDEDYVGSYEATTPSPYDEVQYDNAVEVTEKEILDDNITEVYFDEQRNDDTAGVEFPLTEKSWDYQNASGELKHENDDNNNDDDYINYDEYTESSTEIDNSTELERNMQPINNETIPVLVVTNNDNNKSLEAESVNVTTVNPMTLQIPIITLSENITDNYHVENSDEVVTEGILIFTDEIPQTEVKDESRGNEDAGDDNDEERVETMSTDPISLDYVDDNYEPENYHEEKSIESPIDKEKITGINSQMNESVADFGNYTTKTVPDTTPATTSTSISSTIPNAITSTTIFTTPITTTTSLSSSTIASTANPRTKPTTIKLFKSMITRKNYVYIPPSTTAVSVKIKSRPSLYNPKPAKPPKSYNELAPKPIIRKIVLNARRIPPATPIRNSLNDVSEFTTRYVSESPPSDNQIPDTTPVIEHTTKTQSSDPIIKEVTANMFDGVVENTTLDQEEIIGKKTTMIDKTSTDKKMVDVIIVTPETPHSTTTIYDNSRIGSSTLASVQPTNRRSISIHKRNNAFICPRNFESKRFYADKRDCRLFHYCSYGYSSHQLLDFRFVCEEGTIFDEETQSCIHHEENSKCLKRMW